MGDESAGSSQDRSVDVALAEFQALRAEITGRLAAQVTFLSLGLTALAVIVGFVVKDGGDKQLLLAVPPVALFVSLLFAGETYRILLIGGYIRDSLWPFLQEWAEGAPSWEASISAVRRSTGFVLLGPLFGDGPVTALLAVVSVTALIAADDGSAMLYGIDVAATVIAVGVPIALGLVTRKESADSKLSESKPASADPH